MKGEKIDGRRVYGSYLIPSVPFVSQVDGYKILPSDGSIIVTGAVNAAVTLPVQGIVVVIGTKSGALTIGETVTGSISGATGLVVSQNATSISVQMTSATQFGLTDTITGGTSHATVTAITKITNPSLPEGLTIAVSNGLTGGANVTINAVGGPTIGNSGNGTSEVAWTIGDTRTFRWDGSEWWVVAR
jgi:hypothetical protein